MQQTSYTDGRNMTEYFDEKELPQRMRNAADTMLSPGVSAVRFAKIGRNDPCPCRSGRKFKKCCISKMQRQS